MIVRRRHHGVVCVCGHDAEPRFGGGRPGKTWLTPKTWIGPTLLCLVLLVELCRSIGLETDHPSIPP